MQRWLLQLPEVLARYEHIKDNQKSFKRMMLLVSYLIGNKINTSPITLVK